MLCSRQQLLSPRLDGGGCMLEQLPRRVGEGQRVVLQAWHGHLAAAERKKENSKFALLTPSTLSCFKQNFFLNFPESLNHLHNAGVNNTE